MKERLQGINKIFLDTAPFIYYAERHPIYYTTMELFFQLRHEFEITIVTSPVTLAESLIHPQREQLHSLVSLYRDLICNGEDVEFRTIGEESSILASRLRVLHKLSLTDAFQLAIATTAGCDAFLTNDFRFKTIEHLDVMVVQDFI